ncbi:MAG: hypothetical protein UV73_C0009G0015 [Candidatus Gottesmanbacteria bacterium GW2011_GWA2_43_14]|uniref:Uncharacterized protein n=1 Tax=Candidatus Gottesmanbacteria bacterium GW2011_GWA2_43_14 TaxID=1618443 RepID=A0A0G1DG82_9BACT|nr:MAG: hypothetical protein UV73_C0009G0015 [Candidatus Gottesmanbacteria bacterium GW2011_GWA2_43_14]
MKKDVLSALVLGFLMGAVAALVIVRLPTIVKTTKSASDSAKNAAISPAENVADNSSIVISKPKNNAIVTDNKIEIEGKTNNAQAVTFESYKNSIILQPEADGSFKATIDLVEGGNSIHITRIDANQNDETKVINVFYTTEKI